MSSARYQSFRPEISGLELEGRRLLSTAGGACAPKFAMVAIHIHDLGPEHHILPVRTPRNAGSGKVAEFGSLGGTEIHSTYWGNINWQY